ncbi:MAG: SPL family radical SAM protein [Candidatus Geothermincolia bacterium]
MARKSATLHDFPYASSERKCFHQWIVNVTPPGRDNCLHGCVYCYARDAVYARNEPGVLRYYEGLAAQVERELARLRLCPPVSISNVTDPCQPVPELKREVRDLVGLLVERGVSFSLTTKGDATFLADLLASPRRGSACLAVTIEGPAAALELLSPAAPPLEERLASVKRLARLLPVMVRVDPVFPPLLAALYGDAWRAEMRGLLRRAGEAGATHIVSSTGRMSVEGKARVAAIIAELSSEEARRFERGYRFDRSRTAPGYMLPHPERLAFHREMRGWAEESGMTYAVCQELRADEADSAGIPHCEGFSLPFCERGLDGRFHPIDGCTANCHVACAGQAHPPCGRGELVSHLPFKRSYLV